MGIGPGSPIYFDMENYSRTATNSSAVLNFLAAWTTQLHAEGYASGDVGWFANRFNFMFPGMPAIPTRLTGVVVREARLDCDARSLAAELISSRDFPVPIE